MVRFNAVYLLRTDNIITMFLQCRGFYIIKSFYFKFFFFVFKLSIRSVCFVSQQLSSEFHALDNSCINQPKEALL